jgi:hypothetical protein
MRQESADSKGGVAIHRCHGSPFEFNWINSIWKCFYGVSPDDGVPGENVALFGPLFI